MLSFIDSLKQTISHIHTTGGDLIERTLPSDILVQHLREYAVQQVVTRSRSQYTLLDWFVEGTFYEYVRVCVIHLRKLGITDEEKVFNLITKVIDKSLKSEPGLRDPHNFDDLVTIALLEVWDRVGDEQTSIYTFAQDRWLISWNYQLSRWYATSLGLFLLELSPMQVCMFLLSIDFVLSTGDSDFRHISRDMVRDNFKPQQDSNDIRHLSFYHRNIISRLGLTIDIQNFSRPRKLQLTPVGDLVISRVLSKENPYRGVIRSLISSEELGSTFGESSVEIQKVLQIINSHHLIDKTNKELILSAIQLYETRKYQEALRVIYPSLENIVYNVISRMGKQGSQPQGLKAKLQHLAQKSIISSDTSSAIEIIATMRNKILHGNFEPDESSDPYLLCLFTFRYIGRLLFETKSIT